MLGIPSIRQGAGIALSHPPIPDWQEQLQASLRRAQDAIARGSTQQEQMVREWTESLRSAYPDWGRERWQRRLAERPKSRLTRKRKVRRRGVLSVRRTLRKNLSTGGFPARLVFRSKRPERPEILVLCDVSDSVRNVSRLMLQFVYTLQELYARVRSFVFVSEIGEVTHLFKKMDVAAAVDLATASRVINVAANSNYGHAFKMFHSTWLGSVTRRSTVIVIGDGRTNYNPPNAWVLGEVKRKARRVIWLCPEDPGSWGFGDSEMPLYARHCTRVEVVKSVDDLGRVAAELMP